MPLVKGDNLSFSPGAICDLIYSEAPLAAGSLGNWTGPAGVWTSFAAAGIFDVRQYTQLHITLAATAVTGTSTPTASPLIMTMDGPDIASAVQGPQFTITPTIGAAGGVVDAVWGVVPTAEVSMTINVAVARSAHRIRFFKLGIGTGGSPTGYTNGRLFIWGYR